MSEQESRRLLLAEVFGGQRYSPGYLEWLYRENPDGNEIATDELSNGHCRGHYAVIPQNWSDGSRMARLALSLNTAIGEEFRGKGLFVILAEETYRRAAAKGIVGIVGVANANSTPGFLRRLNFSLVGSMPVRIGLVWPFGRRAHIHEATQAFLNSPQMASLCASLVVRDWQVAWNLERLRWRLSAPSISYHIHIAPDCIGITRRILHAGLPFVALLKLLPRGEAAQIDVTPILRAAALAYRTPFFLYAGWNDAARFRGVPIPKRLKPSPLNLIYRQLLPGSPPLFSEKRHLEFLDFDAY